MNNRGHAEQLERGEREAGREIVSTMDEAASTTDGLGCVDPDGVPGAEALVESRLATTAAAAGGGDGGVEVGGIGPQSRRESGPAEAVTAGGGAHRT